MDKIIYYDKIFPKYNDKNILNKLKIDIESVSFISSPFYSNKILKIIINHLKTNKFIITDCTAGCGGDTINFLKKCKKVYSIECDPIRYLYLKNNICAYNLMNNSNIFFGNFLNIIKTISDHDVIYIDPPWGGKNYKKNKNLKIIIDDKKLEDIIIDILSNCIKIPKLTILKLPINYDIKFFYYKLKSFGKIYLYNLKKMFILVIY